METIRGVFVAWEEIQIHLIMNYILHSAGIDNRFSLSCCGVANVSPDGLIAPWSEPELEGCFSTTLTPACLNGFYLFWLRSGVFNDFFRVSSSKFVLLCKIRRLAGGGREQFSLGIITWRDWFITLSIIVLGFSTGPRFTELTIGIWSAVVGSEPYLGTELSIPPIPAPGVNNLTSVYPAFTCPS